MSMLRTFDPSHASRVDPLRGPALPHKHGTFSLGDDHHGDWFGLRPRSGHFDLT
jgi:hypothetical protein